MSALELGALFAARYNQKHLDDSGRVLEERTRRVMTPADANRDPLDYAQAQPVAQRISYRYAAPYDSVPDQVTIRGGGDRVREILSDPELVARNPYFPDGAAAWTRWNSTRFGDNGSELFTSVVYTDSTGRRGATASSKQNAKSKAAVRISYRLPAPAPDGWSQSAEIDLGGVEDFSDCHFLACYVRGEASGEAGLVIADAAGAKVTVSGSGKADLGFWSDSARTVQWLPAEEDARQAASVTTELARGSGARALVVSVPALRAAGIDHRRINSIALIDGRNLEHSNMLRLSANEKVLASRDPTGRLGNSVVHSSGIVSKSVAIASGARGSEERAEQYWNADLEFGGRPVARIRTRHERSEYPIIIFEDHSDPESPQPLYALVAEDGSFLERYRTLDQGRSLVYTIAPGFRAPKLEVYRPEVLEDESSPSLVAYGDDYQVNLPLSRTRKIHNQIASSIFKLAGDAIFNKGDSGRHISSPLAATELHGATAQAEAIAALPTLAESLLPHRPLPWDPELTASQSPSETDPIFEPAEVAGWLRQRLRGKRFLLTAPGTQHETYIATVEEARLIRLALRVGEYHLAADVLDFYWDESKGGTTPVHASYDWETGASLAVVPRYKRPTPSPRSALAQVAIAEAALDFAEVTGDANAFHLARSLLDVLWSRYRMAPDSPGGGGIVESFASTAIVRGEITLWPEAQRYQLETNARTLTALYRLEEIGEKFGGVPEARSRIDAHGAWMRERVVGPVEQTGIVPNGLFQIQSLQSETEAIGISRWTDAPAWLAFLEAADRMGVERKKTHLWLEHLARVHGVLHGEHWGLDWTLALSRPDALSVPLTAQFFEVASRLEHRAAANFARAELVKILAETPAAPPP